ncbi:MAG: type II toxin-antitoxin system PemK/MazF family toxin [Alphaproteobacteria bacterium]|nr:type II toxin-antitoxin system PemK/MazF family toxin [Alphaproteobacteria bacterium]
MTIPFGAIVLTDFPFTDLTTAKRRPALVVSTDNDRRSDLVVAYITSVPRDEPDGVPIAATSGTGLKTASIVRFDKIATISTAIIAGRLGFADPAWLATHRRAFFWRVRVFQTGKLDRQAAEKVGPASPWLVTPAKATLSREWLGSCPQGVRHEFPQGHREIVEQGAFALVDQHLGGHAG